MDRSIAMLLIGLVFGGGLGFVVAGAEGVSPGHDHADPAQHGANKEHAAHDHGQVVSLAADSSAPSLSVHVLRDPSSGWNLHMETKNFAFSPQNASAEHVPGEGHAHVYINGVKLGRYYGPWLHLDNLPEGEVTVEITLNANDHRLLAVGDKLLSETVVIRN